LLFSPLFHYISSVTLTQRTLYNTYYNIIQHLLQHLLQRRTAKKPKRERRKPPVKNAILAQGGAGMSVDQYNAVATQEWSKNLLKCQYCDRTFREEAFKHHQNACGPGKSGSKKVGMALNTNGLGLGEVARSKQRGRGVLLEKSFLPRMLTIVWIVLTVQENLIHLQQIGISKCAPKTNTNQQHHRHPTMRTRMIWDDDTTVVVPWPLLPHRH